MRITRREFIRRNAAATAAAVAGIPLPGLAQNTDQTKDAAKLKWSKHLAASAVPDAV